MTCLGRVRSVLGRTNAYCWAEMDHYELGVAELGVALAVAHLAELHRQADRRHLASHIAGRT